MNIIVAGGTGFIGKRIVNSFVENGFNVCVLTRNASKHKTTFSKNRFFPKKYFSVTGATCEIRKTRVFRLTPPTFLKKYGTYGLLPGARHNDFSRRSPWYGPFVPPSIIFPFRRRFGRVFDRFRK
mgnify:CR=1 FL=1